MDDILTVLALVFFAVAAIWSAVTKGWILALVAAGLFCVTLAAEGGITLGK